MADTGPQCAARALERAGRQKILLRPRATLTVGPCSQTGAFASRSGLRSQLGLARGRGPCSLTWGSQIVGHCLQTCKRDGNVKIFPKKIETKNSCSSARWMNDSSNARCVLFLPLSSSFFLFLPLSSSFFLFLPLSS